METVYKKPVSLSDVEMRRKASSRTGYKVAKRVFDVAFSGCVTAILLAPCAVLGVAIKLDSKGPVIYKRWCVGKAGKPFPMYKFRTMHIEPPEEILTPEQYEQWKREIKVDDDPRITRVGHMIRPLSIDELPQFLNVLNGTMSVVGPRPITAEEAEMYGELKDGLLSVKPGIAWDIIAPKPEACKKVSGARILPAYKASRTVRAVAA